MQKRLLVLTAGFLQVPVIKKAKEMGAYVIAADGNSEAPGFKYSDKAVVANITSEELMLEIARNERIDGVIHPCSEVAMNVMGRINDELGLCGISREAALKATNKHLMRIAFEKSNAPSPWSECFEFAEDAWQLYEKTSTNDMILKPSRNSGSRGICKISKGLKKTEFEAQFERSKKESRDKTVMLEQFIDGPEFSVEIIIWEKEIHILAVTDKKTTGAPYFVELGHNQPSCFKESIVNIIEQAAYEGVVSLKLNNCAAHAEIKLHEGNAYIMEIGARLGGDFISTDLTRLSTGVDMVEAAVNVALGVKPDLTPKEHKHGVCIRYFCPIPGKVIKIENENILKNDPSVYSYEIYHREGDMVNEVKSSLDRSGHVIVIGGTPQQAIRHAEDLINTVKIYTI